MLSCFFWGRERQGDKFYLLCLNSGAAPLFSCNINSLFLSNWATWDNCEMVWKDAESIFQWLFHGRRRCRIVGSPNAVILTLDTCSLWRHLTLAKWGKHQFVLKISLSKWGQNLSYEMISFWMRTKIYFRIKDFILSCLINLVLKKRFKATSVMSSVLQSVGMQTAEVTKWISFSTQLRSTLANRFFVK